MVQVSRSSGLEREALAERALLQLREECLHLSQRVRFGSAKSLRWLSPSPSTLSYALVPQPLALQRLWLAAILRGMRTPLFPIALVLSATLAGAQAPSRTVPTVDQLLSLKRAGSPEISPDGRLVAYTDSRNELGRQLVRHADLARRRRRRAPQGS